MKVLALTLIWSVALACPNGAQVAGLEVFELDAACPMPLARGFVLTPEAWAENTARVKGLNELVKETRGNLGGCRAERDGLREHLIALAQSDRAMLARLTDELDKVSEPPSRVVWAALGAGGALAVIATVLALD